MPATLSSGQGHDSPIFEQATSTDAELAHLMRDVETRGARIVLADDNREMREFVEQLLASHWNVEAVADGAAAIESVRRDRPDLVVGDLSTSEGDDLELVRSLRKDPSTATVRVMLLSARGDEQSRVEAFDAGADDYLARPFSARDLVGRVQSQVALSRLRSTVERYEAELVSARNSSEELTAKAREEARRKDEFLAMLGHELRNPLAPIMYAVDVLKLDSAELDRDRLTRTVEVIERQTKQMARLVDDLLDVSRITRGTVKLQKQPTTLADVVASAVDAARPLIDARSHRLSVSLPEQSVPLEVDPARISQSIANLLNNAAKYTAEGGVMRLEARVEADRCHIVVSDNGIGIDADMLPRVFDLFTQADESLDRARGGLGVGLTVVQRLVEMHGGEVEASSEGLGHGSRFTISLPVSAPRPSEGNMTSVDERPSVRPLRILIVDDNSDASESLAELLRMLGDEVATAMSGQAALELLEPSRGKGYRPDVALLDIGLPGMDGFELGKRLRRLLGADVLLVALTGYGRDVDQGMARAAGFDHHVLKPADRNELKQLLEGVRKKTD